MKVPECAKYTPESGKPKNRNGRISFAGYDGAKCYEADTLRAAIDAAMKGETHEPTRKPSI